MLIIPKAKCAINSHKCIHRVKVLECSAKDDTNITEIFRSIVSLSRVLHAQDGDEGISGLKRRSSAYVSATSKGECNNLSLMHCLFVGNLRKFINF